jgi:hypothetical protein
VESISLLMAILLCMHAGHPIIIYQKEFVIGAYLCGES